MKEKFYCEVCDEMFEDREKCLDHEEKCSTTETRWCYKCGKTEEWNNGDNWAFTNAERWHDINLGWVGYGSGLDGSEVNFTICDDCLTEFIKTFTLEGQEKVFNSGSNRHLPTEIWLKEARGELTDEEYEECGMYSPRQRTAYLERFPVCDKVKIYEYKDGSKRSRCFRMAFGNGDGTAEGHQTSEECYGCEHFSVRLEGSEIPVVYEDR